MSISSEITRISNAKTAIAQSIANKGVTVPSGTKIDGMASLIDSIQTGGGGAVQPSKALTVTSNGTTTITPDAPYDAIKQVDLTVNVSGGGAIDYTTIATTWAKYNCDFSVVDDKTISVTGNFTGLAAVLCLDGASFAVFTLGNPPAGTATSLCLNGYVWCFTSIDNGELLVLKTAEDVSFQFMAEEYIYLQPA